jgi:hypothetical protein
MSWKRHRALWFFMLLTASACKDCNCGGPTLVPDPPHPDQQDEFCQRPASKVDILWVIDNSGSMSSEQKKLADRFTAFFKQLNSSLVDFHIGVVTTSLRTGFTEDVNGILRRYNGPSVPGCTNCRFLTKDVPCNSDRMDRQDGESTADFEARLVTDCPAVLVFRKLVSAGDMGSAFETGLEASTLALGAIIDPDTGFYRVGPNNGPDIPSQNEGFVRRRSGTCDPAPGTAGLNCAAQPQDNCSEPSLYVIFVSDEQDNSPGLSRYYYRVIEGLKGPGNEGKISASAITGWPNMPTVAMDRACDILQKSWDMDTSNDGDLPALQDILANGDGTEPACRDTTDTDMGTNGSKVGSRYVDVVCRTGGQLANLCSDDYSTALDKLGADAAGLARRFTLSKWDDIYWGDDGVPFAPSPIADDPDLNCDGDDTRHPESDKGLCVMATPLGGGPEVNVPRDNATGYRLETSTHSIRFDGSFLPRPGTKVTIRYQLKKSTSSQQ